MATWIFDPAHSSVSFAIRHIMISNVRGHVSGVKGWVEYDLKSGALATLEATMEVTNFCTGNSGRDEHLKTADFFHVKEFPTITFQSKTIERQGALAYRVSGVLRIHGVEKDVALDCTFLGTWAIPQKESTTTAPSIAFTGCTTIDRRDFGITWNKDLPGGGLGVSNDVTITLDIEAREKHADEECPVCAG